MGRWVERKLKWEDEEMGSRIMSSAKDADGRGNTLRMRRCIQRVLGTER